MVLSKGTLVKSEVIPKLAINILVVLKRKENS